MSTDLVENFKSERIGCKISVSKGLEGVLTRETGMSQTQEIKIFSA